MQEKVIPEEFSKRLNDIISENSITPEQLNEKLGFKAKSTIYRYLKGEMCPKITTVKIISQMFNINPAWLMGYDVPKTLTYAKKSIRIPVLGSIPAGIPIELIQDILDYEDISEEMLKGGKEYFALKVKGNSMEPKYLDGDVLIVLKQNNCESGQDCIVMVNGNDGTFKRVFKTDGGITLQPLNNEYMPAFYSNEDIINKPVKILGIVKEIRRSV